MKRFLSDGMSLPGHGALRGAPAPAPEYVPTEEDLAALAAWFDTLAETDDPEQALAAYAAQIEREPSEREGEVLAALIEQRASESPADGLEGAPADGDPQTAPEGADAPAPSQDGGTPAEETAEDPEDDFAALAAGIED